MADGAGAGMSWGDRLSVASSSMNILSQGLGLIQSYMGASAAAEEARAAADALKKEKRYNIGVLEQRKKDQGWSDMMSAWFSGTTTGFGTSQRGTMVSNQNVLQREIDFQTEMYDVQIGNYEKAAERRFLGIF